MTAKLELHPTPSAAQERPTLWKTHKGKTLLAAIEFVAGAALIVASAAGGLPAAGFISGGSLLAASTLKGFYIAYQLSNAPLPSPPPPPVIQPTQPDPVIRQDAHDEPPDPAPNPLTTPPPLQTDTPTPPDPAPNPLTVQPDKTTPPDPAPNPLTAPPLRQTVLDSSVKQDELYRRRMQLFEKCFRQPTTFSLFENIDPPQPKPTPAPPPVVTPRPTPAPKPVVTRKPPPVVTPRPTPQPPKPEPVVIPEPPEPEPQDKPVEAPAQNSWGWKKTLVCTVAGVTAAYLLYRYFWPADTSEECPDPNFRATFKKFTASKAPPVLPAGGTHPVLPAVGTQPNQFGSFPRNASFKNFLTSSKAPPVLAQAGTKPTILPSLPQANAPALSGMLASGSASAAVRKQANLLSSAPAPSSFKSVTKPSPPVAAAAATHRTVFPKIAHLSSFNTLAQCPGNTTLEFTPASTGSALSPGELTCPPQPLNETQSAPLPCTASKQQSTWHRNGASKTKLDPKGVCPAAPNLNRMDPVDTCPAPFRRRHGATPSVTKGQPAPVIQTVCTQANLTCPEPKPPEPQPSLPPRNLVAEYQAAEAACYDQNDLKECTKACTIAAEELIGPKLKTLPHPVTFTTRDLLTACIKCRQPESSCQDCEPFEQMVCEQAFAIESDSYADCVDSRRCKIYT